MDKSGNRHVGVFATRISHLGWVSVSFFDAGNYLTSNWTIWVARVDEVKIVRRNSSREFGPSEEYSCTLFLAELEMLLNIS